MSVLIFLLGIALGIGGTLVYSHFHAAQVKDLGDAIVNKVDPPKS